MQVEERTEKSHIKEISNKSFSNKEEKVKIDETIKILYSHIIDRFERVY